MRLLALALAVIALSQSVVANAARDQQRAWEALSEARAVLLLRHASAPGIGDPPGFVLEDCSTQRNLSEAGKSQARRWGELLKRKGIDKPRVLSSRWCRCLDTANEMELTNVEPFPLLDSFFIDSTQSVTQTDELRRFLNQAPVTVPLVMISHQVNITALTGVFPQSGEGLVIALPMSDPVTVLARIDPP